MSKQYSDLNQIILDKYAKVIDSIDMKDIVLHAKDIYPKASDEEIKVVICDCIKLIYLKIPTYLTEFAYPDKQTEENWKNFNKSNDEFRKKYS